MSKVISALDLDNAQRWQLPDLGDAQPRKAPAYRDALMPTGAKAPSADEIEAIKQSAREDGFAEGHREGLQTAKSELAEHASRLASILRSLAKPLDELDGVLEQELVELAVAIARQVIRREIKADPNQIVAVVREARNILPASARDLSILLHPDDATIVREVMVAEEENQPWRIADDPVITRGGCKVVTQTSYVDATIEAQIAKIAARLLGGDRSTERAAADGGTVQVDE